MMKVVTKYKTQPLCLPLLNSSCWPKTTICNKWTHWGKKNPKLIFKHFIECSLFQKDDILYKHGHPFSFYLWLFGYIDQRAIHKCALIDRQERKTKKEEGGGGGNHTFISVAIMSIQQLIRLKRWEYPFTGHTVSLLLQSIKRAVVVELLKYRKYTLSVWAQDEVVTKTKVYNHTSKYTLRRQLCSPKWLSTASVSSGLKEAPAYLAHQTWRCLSQVCYRKPRCLEHSSFCGAGNLGQHGPDLLPAVPIGNILTCYLPMKHFASP